MLCCVALSCRVLSCLVLSLPCLCGCLALVVLWLSCLMVVLPCLFLLSLVLSFGCLVFSCGCIVLDCLTHMRVFRRAVCLCRWLLALSLDGYSSSSNAQAAGVSTQVFSAIEGETLKALVDALRQKDEWWTLSDTGANSGDSCLICQWWPIPAILTTGAY